MATCWQARLVHVYVVAETNIAVAAHNGVGFQVTPHKTFDQVPKVDVLWVPGAAIETIAKQMQDRTYLDFLRSRSEHASFVTSVCEGALLLAAAGLLDGYSATTHWSVIPCLKKFTKVKVAEGHPRYVVDRNRVTGGGISSGLDEALELIRLIVDKDGGDGVNIAEQVQVITQYFPKPPVCGKIPEPTPCTIDLESLAQ
jgi:cyclohexyl-isocyanide hydratase